MPFRRSLSTLVLACAAGVALPAHAVEATPLDAQIKRLAGLLGDSYARAYPDSAMVQTLSLPQGRTLAVAVFTIESFGGGNNHRQYLARFEQDRNEAGPIDHFALLDVMLIGAKGWRAIPALKVESRVDAKTGKVLLAIPAMANTENDALNFPSRKTTIRLELDRELRELKGETP
jgi:hypothetical protein